MGIFDFLKPQKHGQFISERTFNDNRYKQLKMTSKILDQLRKLNVTESKELELEYFFYTNTEEKAENLNDELIKLNYESHYSLATHNSNEYVITGKTNRIKMTNNIVLKWSVQMCELGYNYDCCFDGWGTNPNQD